MGALECECGVCGSVAGALGVGGILHLLPRLLPADARSGDTRAAQWEPEGSRASTLHIVAGFW